MSRIAFLSPTFASGDAVCNDLLGMACTLTRRGHEVELFCSLAHDPEPRDRRGRRVASFLGRDPGAVVVYQHTIGWAAAVAVVRRLSCRRVVRYHNVTPPHFFAPVSAEFAENCRLGREQVADLAAAGCDLYLPASDYSRAELVAAGTDPRRCRVLPPFHRIDDLARLPPDPDVLEGCRDGRTNVLFVGRQAPNKGHHHLIAAFAAYHARYDPDSRLILVGKIDPRLAGYVEGQRRRAEHLGLRDRVVFVDGASEGELRAYYEAAHAFLLASEHEGFCVPAVEAMALGVPVVAYGTTAVPATVADAGLVWDEPDPLLLAESLACAARDGHARPRLVERGRRRYREHFSNERIRQQFLQALQTISVN